MCQDCLICFKAQQKWHNALRFGANESQKLQICLMIQHQLELFFSHCLLNVDSQQSCSLMSLEMTFTNCCYNSIVDILMVVHASIVALSQLTSWVCQANFVRCFSPHKHCAKIGAGSSLLKKRRWMLHNSMFVHWLACKSHGGLATNKSRASEHNSKSNSMTHGHC